MLYSFALLCLLGFAFGAPRPNADQSRREKRDHEEVPANIYHPSFGPEHDAHNISQLSPATSRDLYYSQEEDDDTQLSHMFANLKMDFKKPAIILEDTDYISTVKCSKKGLNIEFSSQEAYDFALDQWTDFSGESLKNDFILVSHSDGCEATSSGQGQRTFWLVDETVFAPEARACAVKCKEIAVQEAANSMKATWGSFENKIPKKAPAKKAAPRSVPDAGLRHRGIGDIINGAGDVIEGAVETGEDIVDGARVAVSNVLNPKISKTLYLELDASQPDDGTGPWSGVKAQKVINYKNVDVYAAGCGVSGSATVNGEASFSFTQMKITSGTFNVKGAMNANLGIGLVSEGLSKSLGSKTFNIVQVPLSPLTIPEIVTLGPYINVGGSVDFSVEASGNVLATVGASLPNFAASIDLLDSSQNSQSGFYPTWTHHFEATGEITVSSTLAMPVQIGVGLSVPKIEGLNATVSVTNTPSLTAYGNFSNEAGPCQCGIGWGVYFKESTALDVVGVYSPTLQTWQSPDLASGCVANVAPESVCHSDTLANKKTEKKTADHVGDSCTATGFGQGTCTAESSGCAGGTFHEGFCSGPATTVCCVKDASQSSGSNDVGTKCSVPTTGDGLCANKSSGCSGGAFYQGYCPGDSNIQCCVKDPPSTGTGTGGTGSETKCSVPSVGDGLCGNTASACSGGAYHKGYCPGAANIQCCVKEQET